MQLYELPGAGDGVSLTDRLVSRALEDPGELPSVTIFGHPSISYEPSPSGGM